LQEWAVKVFKRSYISGDPAKFRDYEAAEGALTEVRHSTHLLLVYQRKLVLLKHVSETTDT
jgi:hypothetical protein